MKKVLALLGSNFLGHITNVLPITNFLKQQNFEIDIVIIPFAKVHNPPIINFLRLKNIKFTYIDCFASSKSLKNVFSYLDLLYMYDFNDDEKITRYYQYISNKITEKDYSLVISDFTLFSSIICKERNIKFVAIRSHSLKVFNYENEPIELFNWWDTLPLENLNMIKQMKKTLFQNFNIDSFDRVLYNDLTITPGFFPFDDAYPNFGKHHFVIEKKKPKQILPEKDVYIYVRSISILNDILHILKRYNKSYYIIDTNLNSEFIDLWEAVPNSKILISHGGHGMCVWSIYNKLFHIVLPDNNDRLSNAKRLKKMGFGEYFLSLVELDDINSFNFSINSDELIRNNFETTSISFDEFSQCIFTQLEKL